MASAEKESRPLCFVPQLTTKDTKDTKMAFVLFVIFVVFSLIYAGLTGFAILRALGKGMAINVAEFVRIPIDAPADV
jgi:hypothetical protein